MSGQYIINRNSEIEILHHSGGYTNIIARGHVEDITWDCGVTKLHLIPASFSHPQPQALVTRYRVRGTEGSWYVERGKYELQFMPEKIIGSGLATKSAAESFAKELNEAKEGFK